MEHGWNRVPAALTDDNNHFALTVLVANKTTVAAVLFVVCGLEVAAEIAAIDLSCLALAILTTCPDLK
jgi:hypothetical protein